MSPDFSPILRGLGTVTDFRSEQMFYSDSDQSKTAWTLQISQKLDHTIDWSGVAFDFQIVGKGDSYYLYQHEDGSAKLSDGPFEAIIDLNHDVKYKTQPLTGNCELNFLMMIATGDAGGFYTMGLMPVDPSISHQPEPLFIRSRSPTTAICRISSVHRLEPEGRLRVETAARLSLKTPRISARIARCEFLEFCNGGAGGRQPHRRARRCPAGGRPAAPRFLLWFKSGHAEEVSPCVRLRWGKRYEPRY